MSKIIILDFNKPLLNPTMQETVKRDGKDVLLKDQVTQTISQQTKGDSLKYLEWLREIGKTGKLSVDKSDYEAVRKIFEEDQSIFAFCKGQILEEIIDAKDRKPVQSKTNGELVS